MRHLGEITVSSDESVRQARRNLRAVLARLTGDALLATRMATCVSQVCRQREADGELSMALAIAAEERPPRFVLELRGPETWGARDLLNRFFLHVDAEEPESGERIVSATRPFEPAEPLSEEFLSELSEIVRRKNRRELMTEITERNRELQDSLENLRRTRSAKERMESELNIGRRIQMSMLPAEFPPFPDRPEFSIFATLEPAREVGGDLYDFFFVDRDLLCFCVGDVSGKGVPSALFAAVTKALIGSFAQGDRSPASIVTKANGNLSRNNEEYMFVTLLLALLDVRTGELVYTNAGHNPPYVKRVDGSVHPLKEAHGPIAGALPGTTYSEGRLQLTPGDLLFLYTDGVTEAMDEKEELFSDGRLEELLNASGIDSVETAVHETLLAIRAFEAGAMQADDITIMALQFEGRDTGLVERFELTTESTADAAHGLQQALHGFLVEKGVSGEAREKVRRALDGLLGTGVSVAAESGETHQLSIVVTVDECSARFSVSEEGVPYNPFGTRPLGSSAPDPAADVAGIVEEAGYERFGNRNVVSFSIPLGAPGTSGGE